MTPASSEPDALTLLRAGDFAAAADAFSARVAANPRDADALHWLGVIAVQAGAADDAVKLLTAAVDVRPDFADAWANLATANDLANDAASAESAARRAVALDPTQPIFRFNLGNLLAKAGRHRDAMVCFEAALALRPRFPEALGNLGIACRELNDLPRAVTAFECACEQAPESREAHYNLANAYRDSGRLTDAERKLRQVVGTDPSYAKAWNTLGNLMGDMARPEDALQAFEQACAAAPTWAPAASNRLSALQYVPGQTATTLHRAHGAWARAAGFDLPQPRDFSGHDRNRDRALRIGFISPDFATHPVGFLSVGLFEQLDHSRLTPFVFSLRRADREDDVSRRISATTTWIRATDASNDALTQDIISRRIDILFDMSGHTSGHRLAVFARKPVPVQVSWIGYVGTTGLGSMDYVLADHHHVPVGRDFPGPEAYLRMPAGYVCFDRSGMPQPRDRNTAGAVTFGCLNNPAKLNRNVIASFAKILSEAPDSRLILAFRGLDDTATRSQLHQAFANHGVRAERIDIRGGGPRAQFLATYDEIDIALDTFPYSGGLTTCEALAMGVPVVTFPGDTFASRHATSHLNAAGLPELVATDQRRFEELAISLGKSSKQLLQIRKAIQNRFPASPLCDARRFAREFEIEVRRAWVRWCESVSPGLALAP